MKGKLLGKMVSLAAAVAMAVTGFSAVPVSAEEEDINLEEFFASAGGVKQVSLGFAYSAALTNNGDLYTWGDNLNGQLGNGTDTDSLVPIKVMENVASIDVVDFRTAAITTNGDLYMWGRNFWGELGNGTVTDSSVPVKIMSGVASVSLGGAHSAAVTTSGEMYAWGGNGAGQLGDGTKKDSLVPIKIMDNVASVSVGGGHSAVITTDGDLYTWGGNSYGQLGDGTKTNSSAPVKIMSNVASVSCRNYRSAAITTSGDLYVWGENSEGQLGNGTKKTSLVPVKVMSNAKSVTLGDMHSAAITTSGELYTWGLNSRGQLGNGTEKDSAVPIKIMNNVASVGVGSFHSAATTANGDLYIWGHNDSGQLGNGTSGLTNYICVPTKLDFFSGTETPASPKITKAVAGNGQVALNWTSVSGAQQYAVYTYVNSKWTLAGKTTALGMYVRGLTNGTKYGFAVKAYVNGAWTGITSSDIVYATPAVIATKPKITKTIPGNGQVGLNWTSVSGAKQYAVYTYVNGKWTLAGKTTAIGMYVRGLTNGTKYGFAVKAYVNGVWTGITSSDIVYAAPTAPTAKPVITKTIPGDGQVGLNWSQVSGAKQYAVYTYVNSKWTLAGKTTALGMYVRGLTNGTKYGFAVKAYVNGAWTGITSSDIVYATPTAAKSSIIDIDPEDIELFNAVPVIA